MMINLGRSPSGQEYADLMLRQNKILGNMLGADIDFIVRGIDSKTRSVVASRKEAMLRKRQIFYLDTDATGMYRVYEGRIVQARVIAVAEKVVRVEVFGVETSILARDLAWDWIGDAHERFSVGDEVLVRILSVRRNSLEDLGIKADIKSISENTDRDNLQKCRIQGKYAGRVTDVHKGVVYVRLSNGVNAVAHSCYDYRMPGKRTMYLCRHSSGYGAGCGRRYYHSDHPSEPVSKVPGKQRRTVSQACFLSLPKLPPHILSTRLFS